MSLSPEIGNLFDKLADYCWTLKKCADSLSPYPTSSGHITLVGYNITSLWIVFPNYTCAFYLFTNTFVNVHIVLYFPPGINEVKRLLHIGFSASKCCLEGGSWSMGGYWLCSQQGGFDSRWIQVQMRTYNTSILRRGAPRTSDTQTCSPSSSGESDGVGYVVNESA